MSSASATKYAQRTTCSVRVGPDAPYASVGGGAATRTPKVQTPDTTCPSDEIACQRTVYAPCGSVRSVVTIVRGSPVARRARDDGAVGRRTTIESGSAFTPWSKRTQTVRGGRLEPLAVRGWVERRSRARTPLPARRARAARRSASARLIGAAPLRAATGARRPAQGRDRRVERDRDDDEHERKPAFANAHRGRNAREERERRAEHIVQPSKWCRNAERWKSHGFCSCSRNASPETGNASGVARRQSWLCSLPRTSPSSAAPASIIAWAHAPCATMWIVEFVKNVITGHIRTPIRKSERRPEIGRHVRLRQTSSPDDRPRRAGTARAAGSRSRTSSARARRAAASAPRPRGRRAARARRADGKRARRASRAAAAATNSHQKRLAVGVQQGDAVRLDDRPADAGERGQRAERAPGAGPASGALGVSLRSSRYGLLLLCCSCSSSRG